MTTPKTIGTLIKADPRFDTLIAPGTTLEVLADGYDWSEGPVWVPRDGGFLLWSDVPANTIYKWSPGEGRGRVHEAVRLHRRRQLQQRAGQQRPDARQAGPPDRSPSTAIAASRATTGTGGKRTLADN